jgi:hypothetical protein
MSVLTSPKTYAALAAFHAGDAVACAIPVPYIAKILDSVEVPTNIRWVFPVVKAAAAVGLASVYRVPALARLTTALLTVYFALAVGAHVRVRDRVANIVPAATFLATFAALTVKGPPPRTS